jgi:methylated-DNA-[protein]-cysteine S-methyltransferase
MNLPTAWSAKMRTPFATLGVVSDGRALTVLHYLPLGEREQAPSDAIAERAVRELEHYLDDPQFRFGVPLAPRGTPFRRRVWDAISAIPVGESRTYGELSHALHSAPRAIGQACGANPIALIVPCHRVVASGGALGGFMKCAGRAARRGPARRASGDPSKRESPLAADNLTVAIADRNVEAASGDPIAIKRWLLVHEGYRFGLF